MDNIAQNYNFNTVSIFISVQNYHFNGASLLYKFHIVWTILTNSSLINTRVKPERYITNTWKVFNEFADQFLYNFYPLLPNSMSPSLFLVFRIISCFIFEVKAIRFRADAITLCERVHCNSNSKRKGEIGYEGIQRLAR